MNMKKILSGLLAVSMLSASVALAEDGLMLISEDVVEEGVVLEDTLIYDKAVFEGTAKITEEGELYIATEDEQEIVLNTDENTIFTTADGLKIGLEEITDGSHIRVIASSAMTQILPPQVYAYVVMAGEALPIYAEVESVEQDEDGNTVFFSKDGAYKVVAGEETEILPFATRNIVALSDIKEGSQILVYSNLMTMSIPALVPAEKLVLLPEAVVAEDATEEIVEEDAVVEPKAVETEPEKIILNGEQLDASIKNIDGVYLLPVRKICETAGLDVAWDNTLKAVSVGTVPMGVTLNIGVNSYTKARMMPMELSSAPLLIDALTYVPFGFFTDILGAEAVIADGAISLTLSVNLD